MHRLFTSFQVIGEKGTCPQLLSQYKSFTFANTKVHQRGIGLALGLAYHTPRGWRGDPCPDNIGGFRVP